MVGGSLLDGSGAGCSAAAAVGIGGWLERMTATGSSADASTGGVAWPKDMARIKKTEPMAPSGMVCSSLRVQSVSRRLASKEDTLTRVSSVPRRFAL